MRRVSTWLIGVVLAVLALGLAVLVLAMPPVTQALASRNSVVMGFSASRTLEVAEMVRAFVVDGTGELPAVVDGRPGFDESAVSHLIDVQRVIAGARIATGLCALIVMLWLGVLVATRRQADAVPAFRVGAVMGAGLVVLVGVVGLVDFEAFFSAFHGVFFAAGTWTFSFDSLLIQVFPEPFWAELGALWAVLTLAFCAAWWGIGVWLSKSPSTVRA